MSAKLTILGLPLTERVRLPENIKTVLGSAQIIIGESRKVVDRHLQGVQISKETSVFFLDNIATRDLKDLETALSQLKKTGGAAVLFSDVGMPILFDPGKEVLGFCQKLDFEIHCIPGPTSWGTAASLSGWNPPFLMIGFLSPKTDERQKQLESFSKAQGHLVLMDTPYRFTALLNDCTISFGKAREAFLAWEIGLAEERYLWGNLGALQDKAVKLGLKKGEFVLLIKSLGVK